MLQEERGATGRGLTHARVRTSRCFAGRRAWKKGPPFWNGITQPGAVGRQLADTEVHECPLQTSTTGHLVKVVSRAEEADAGLSVTSKWHACPSLFMICS